MENPISLDGVRMHVISTAEGGEVNSETLFEFSQNGSLVSAKYSGGSVKLGYLVGWMASGQLRFRYAQVGSDGQIDGGLSTCDIKQTSEGRLQLIEHFEWVSREGSGINIFEEVGY
jgi:hypothetical protein